MNQFDAFRPVTRRALRINYRSPNVCAPMVEVSGSGGNEVSFIDFLPTHRLSGPVLSIEDAEGGGFNLSWTAVLDAFVYELYRSSVSADGPFTIIAQIDGATTTYLDAPEDAGTYFYKVTAIEPNFGETNPSNVVSMAVTL